MVLQTACSTFLPFSPGARATTASLGPCQQAPSARTGGAWGGGPTLRGEQESAGSCPEVLQSVCSAFARLLLYVRCCASTDRC
eukprot:4334942-Alexandrium_andersonii.AAC.1